MAAGHQRDLHADGPGCEGERQQRREPAHHEVWPHPLWIEPAGIGDRQVGTSQLQGPRLHQGQQLRARGLAAARPLPDRRARPRRPLPPAAAHAPEGVPLSTRRHRFRRGTCRPGRSPPRREQRTGPVSQLACRPPRSRGPGRASPSSYALGSIRPPHRGRYLLDTPSASPSCSPNSCIPDSVASIIDSSRSPPVSRETRACPAFRGVGRPDSRATTIFLAPGL